MTDEAPPQPHPSTPAWSKASAVLRFGPGADAVAVSPKWAFAGADGAGVRVALVDSGIDADHPQLEGCVDTAGSIDLALDDDGTVSMTTGPHGDVFGHGTACAGIIHAMAPKARITSVRVLGPTLTGRAAVFHAGLAWAVDEGFDVINLSLGTTKKDWALAFHEVCDRAYFGGSFVVTAANNVARESYPSLFASVASVACNTSDDPLRFHANPEPPTEFLARGINVEVPWLNGGTTTTTGNSFAAPHIAALAALVKSKHPQLRPFQLKAALYATAANVVEATRTGTMVQPDEVAGRRGTSWGSTALGRTGLAGGRRGTAMALVRPASMGGATPAAEGQATAPRRRTAPGPTPSPSGPSSPSEVVGRWRWGAIRLVTSGESSAGLDGTTLVRDLPLDIDLGRVRRAVAAVEALNCPHVPSTAVMGDAPHGIVTPKPVALDQLDRSQALDCLSRVTSALADLHQAGLVHGDIEPRWLCRDHANEVQLYGAGLAPCLGPPALDGLVAATLANLAPELLSDAEPTAASDVYALGLLWFEVLRGSLPWQPTDRLGELIHQRLQEVPASIASDLPAQLDLPPALIAAIDAALRVEPTARPSARDIAESVEGR